MCGVVCAEWVLVRLPKRESPLLTGPSTHVYLTWLQMEVLTFFRFQLIVKMLVGLGDVD